jgi:phosphoglycolate phosphatase-like HAD superfamily hydrolase
MKIRAILFDVDGVLIDSNKVIIRLFKETAKKMGLREPTDEEIKRLMGQSLEDNIKFLWPECDVKRFAKMYRKKFVKIKIPPFKNASESLEKLKKCEFKLGVVSGKKRFYLEKNLREANFDLNLFDVIISAEDSKEHKPNPKPILIACETLRVKPKETLYVGDSRFDYEAAKSARVNFIAVLSGILTKRELKKLGVKHMINSVSELPDFLSRIKMR